MSTMGTMGTISLQVTYRKGRPLAAYIYLPHAPGQKSVRTRQLGPDLLIDYADDGRPLGIEIVSPADVTVEEIHRAFDLLGLARPGETDLAPLRAA